MSKEGKRGEKGHCRQGSEKRRGGKGGVKGREVLQETRSKQSQFPGGRELEETRAWKCRCRMRVKSCVKAKQDGASQRTAGGPEQCERQRTRWGDKT